MNYKKSILLILLVYGIIFVGCGSSSKELQESDVNLVSIQEKYNKIVAENEELKVEIENLKVENEELKEEIGSLKEENESLKAEIEELKSESDENTQLGGTTNIEKPANEIHLSLSNLKPIIYNDNGIKVSVNSYGFANGKSVYKVKFLVENGGDKEVMVYLTNVVINNFEVSSTLGDMISVGRNGISEGSIWLNDLEEVGITEWSVAEAEIVITTSFWSDGEITRIPVILEKECWDTVQ